MYRIFIVEDDSTMAAVMKKQIESWGHSVHVATQFSDILSEFTAYDPHMVLMDVMLPFSMAITGAVRFGKSPMFL